MSSPKRRDPTSESRQRAAQFFAVIVVFWFSLYVYMPYQSLYLSALGVGAALIGLIMGAYGYAQLILRLPLGLMADRLGRPRFVLILGVSLPVLASLLRLVFPFGWGWLLANLISGIGASSWISFFIEMAELRGDTGMQKSSALVSAANQIGIMSGFVLSVFLYGASAMNRLLWASVLAGSLALALLLDLFRRMPLPCPAKPTAVPLPSASTAVLQPGESAAVSAPAADVAAVTLPAQLPPVKSLLKSSLGDRRLLRYALFGVPQTGLLLASAQSFSINLCRERGGNAWELGLMSVIFMGSAVCFALLCTLPFSRKLKASTLLTLTHLLMLLYFLFVPRMTQVLPLLLFQVIAGLNSGTTAAFAIREAMRQVQPDYANTAMAVYQTAVGAGISFLPMLSGLLVEKLSIAGAYRVMAGFALFLALYAAWLGRLDRQG